MKTVTLALAAVLAFGAAAASHAQPGPPPPGREGPRMQRMDPAQMQARRAEMAERRAQRLRDVLQLRADQEPALKAFLDAGRPPADRMARMAERRPEAPLTTPQRLDRQRERMAERMAMFDRRAAATKRFYAALSPSQQKAFDAMGPAGGRKGGPGGRGPGGRGHRDHMGSGPGPR